MLHGGRIGSNRNVNSNGYKVIHPKINQTSKTKEGFKKFEDKDIYYKKLINKINNK